MFIYSTGETIETQYWNEKAQRLNTKGISKTQAEKNNAVNAVLERHERLLEDTITEYKRTGKALTRDILYDTFEQHFKIKPKEAHTSHTSDFYRIIDTFIEQSKSGNRTTKKGTKITAQRISHYTTFKKNLQDYKPIVDINDITIDFYKGYIKHRNDAGKSLNTIGKEINIFKVILRETFKQNLHTNRIFEHDDFKTFDEDVENVYLSDAELDVLWNLQNLSKKHELVRDIFIVGAYTGLRISDLGILDKFNIIDNGTMLKIIPEKTNDAVFIPIHPKVRQIIKKYNGAFPKAYSDQKMNDYIKEICKIAEFNEQSVYKRTKGGEVEKYTQLKWQRITNHTARRSFATNLYLAGIPTLTIRSITGHLTESSFMKYICVTKKQVAAQIAQHPYFSEPQKPAKKKT